MRLAILVALVAVWQINLAHAWWMFADQPTTGKPAADTYGASPAAVLKSVASGSGARKAVAEFDMDGVKGAFRFSQASATAPTVCDYDIQGLKGNNKMYHVHVKPVPKFDANQVRNDAAALAALCSAEATGGHLNPFNVTAKLPPKSAPFDQYEVGDLSGKHGPLVAMTHPGHEDHYVGSFTDDKLSLGGTNGIIGRSIVIHKNEGGKRWVCATINEAN